MPRSRDAPDKDEVENGEKQSSSSKIGTFFKDNLTKGKKQVVKKRRDLEHSVGLGHKPSVVPPGEADIHGETRTVDIGWHPVAGASGKWFAENTWFGKGITEKIGNHPDPTQHWAVIVGGFVHELWMDVNFDVIYINEELKREEWHTFEVGQTRFNDQALLKAGRMTIHNMRQKRAAYNLISNNCQNFAVNLLDAVQVGAHREFATSFAVYQAATGEGEINDLFADKHPEEQAGGKPDISADEGGQVAGPHVTANKTDTVQLAEQVMDEHTTKVDDHHE